MGESCSCVLCSREFCVNREDVSNCLRKFFYLASTHYEAEHWQDCKKTLLRAIHLAPSNYTFRFELGAVMQKSSSSTLQKKKRTADEVRSTVTEAENDVRVCAQLSAASDLHVHGFDGKNTNPCSVLHTLAGRSKSSP